MAIEVSVNPELAKEETMLKRLLCNAKAFYQDPKNSQGYEAWLEKQNKEAVTHVADNINP